MGACTDWHGEIGIGFGGGGGGGGLLDHIHINADGERWASDDNIGLKRRDQSGEMGMVPIRVKCWNKWANLHVAIISIPNSIIRLYKSTQRARVSM